MLPRSPRSEYLVQPEAASKPTVREARLRPEFADEYKGIEPGAWIPAAALAEQLITRLLREGVPGDELPLRVLDPGHFEFRGGDSRRTTSAPNT